MPGLHDPPVGRHAQRLLLDALPAAAKHRPLTGVDEPRKTVLEFLIDDVTHNTSGP